jgi:hypothetical protein
MRRRTFLKRAGLAAAGVGALAGSAAAQSTASERSPPEHVSISYDKDWLEQYVPHLVISQMAREKLIGLYGLKATSTEYTDTAVAVIWASYTHQESAAYAPATGHWGDHEPIAVEVDRETGDITRLRASIYHWIKGEVTAFPTVEAGKNPLLKVFDNYHHYTAATDESRARAFEVRDLTEKFDAWLNNGLAESLVDGAVYEPWIMRNEEDWWAPGEFGLPLGLGFKYPSGDAVLAQTSQFAGFGITGKLSA